MALEGIHYDMFQAGLEYLDISSIILQVTRSLRKADVCVGCLSPREGEEEGVWCVSEHWILG